MTPLLGSCDVVTGLLSSAPTSAHAEYARGLAEAGLAAMPLAQAWVRAGEESLERPDRVTVPARLEGWFAVDSPTAVALRFAPPRPRWVTVRARLAGDASPRLFLDAFRMPRDTSDSPVMVASASDSAHVVSFRVRGEADFVVRIQPELLRGGAWELEVTASEEEPAERGPTAAAVGGA